MWFQFRYEDKHYYVSDKNYKYVVMTQDNGKQKIQRIKNKLYHEMYYKAYPNHKGE